MSEHRIQLTWSRNNQTFERGNYSRDHQIHFDQQTLNASSATAYGGNADHSDPEQMLAAAVSSCHMLTFLAVVANRGLVVEHYEDEATAELGKNTEGKIVVTKITLHPKVTFSNGIQPTVDELDNYHERAQRNCFIGNSVSSDVVVLPRSDAYEPAE